MTTTLMIAINAVLSLLVVLAVPVVMRFASRLPSSAPADSESRGLDSARVPNEPLPLRQVVQHEIERQQAIEQRRAAEDRRERARAA